MVNIIAIFFTAIGLTPDGSSTGHIYTQTVHRIQRKDIHNNKKKKKLGSAGRSSSLQVIPWHLPYN
jgi:hypothetical protein